MYDSIHKIYDLIQTCRIGQSGSMKFDTNQDRLESIQTSPDKD